MVAALSPSMPPLPLGEGRGEGLRTTWLLISGPHPNPLPKGEGTSIGTESERPGVEVLKRAVVLLSLTLVGCSSPNRSVMTGLRDRLRQGSKPDAAALQEST